MLVAAVPVMTTDTLAIWAEGRRALHHLSPDTCVWAGRHTTIDAREVPQRRGDQDAEANSFEACAGSGRRSLCLGSRRTFIRRTHRRNHGFFNVLKESVSLIRTRPEREALQSIGSFEDSVLCAAAFNKAGDPRGGRKCATRMRHHGTRLHAGSTTISLLSRAHHRRSCSILPEFSSKPCE